MAIYESVRFLVAASQELRMYPHEMNAGSSKVAAPQRLRDRFKEATTLAILSAAEDVFGVSGWHAAKMEDVSQRQGVSVGTLYNHFGVARRSSARQSNRGTRSFAPARRRR